MTDTSIKDNLIARIESLSPDLQRRLLDFAKTLVPRGVKGKSLLRFEGAIAPDDLQLMSKAIEESCEKSEENDE